MSNEPTNPFELSDAPIHRIQSLVLSLLESFKTFEPFHSVANAFFVRRDFDSNDKSKTCPVFNATFYSKGVEKYYLYITKDVGNQVDSTSSKDDGQTPNPITESHLDALHEKALNSAGTRRAALERAIRRLKEQTMYANEPKSVEKIEFVHHWLELYSRVTYRGGIPGFLVEQYRDRSKFPLLDLLGAHQIEGQSEQWKDCIPHVNSGVAEWPATCDWLPQPPITCKNDQKDAIGEIADPLYKVLQQWLEQCVNPADKALMIDMPDQYPLVFPIYEFLHFDGVDEDNDGVRIVTQHGAFLGFVFLLFSQPKEAQANPLSIKETAEAAFFSGRKGIHQLAPHLNAFAASLLESEFEEILREDFQGDDPLAFLAQNLDRIDGWKFVTETPSNQSQGDRQLEIDLRVDLFKPAGPKETAFLITSDRWTQYDDESSIAATKYRTCVNRRIRYYVEQARLQESKKRLGRQSGLVASAHDYSKDIGSVLLRLSDYKTEVDRSMQVIKEQVVLLANLQPPASQIGRTISEELVSWAVPRFDWFQGVRFTNAHLATQTRGILVPEPAECVASLERGRLRDIYDVVRLLVWHPITLQKLKEREEEFTKFAPDKLLLPSTWWTLFSFDLEPSPTSQPFHERLGQRVLNLILKDKITQSDFARRFKIPRINPRVNIEDTQSILWPDVESARWRPLDGLLPLFVFSMRFAFQCAWAKTILDEPEKPLHIEIDVVDPLEDRKYEVRITFPSLLPVGTQMDAHPYYGEWKAQIAHYAGTPIWKTSPWKARAETLAVTQDDGVAHCQLTLTASI